MLTLNVVLSARTSSASSFLTSVNVLNHPPLLQAMLQCTPYPHRIWSFPLMFSRFNIFRPLEPTHRSQSSPSSARPAMYHDYLRESTPASPGKSRRPHTDRIDFSTSRFSDSRPFPPTRRSSDFTNAESNAARMSSDIQDPTSRADFPESNSQHARPRWQSMAPPVPSFGTPARTLSNGLTAFVQDINSAIPPNSRTANSKKPELGHLEELHFLERVCPCTLNGHPCKAEGGCGRQQLCMVGCHRILPNISL